MLTLAAAGTLAAAASVASTLTMTVFGMELNAGNEAYKPLYQGQPGTTAAAVYTVPANTQAFVKTIFVANTSTTLTPTLTLYAGGTTAAFMLLPPVTIPAGGFAMYEDGDGWQVFDNLGQLLQRQGGNSTPLSAALTANTANQTSTTEAVISQVLAVPANSVQPGSTFKVDLSTICAQGAVAQTTPGIVYNLRWGGLAGTIIATTGIITPATALAATAGAVWAMVTVASIGASGTAKGYITATDPRGTRATNGEKPQNVGSSNAAVTIDTTTAKDLVITCKTTVADASSVTFGASGMTFLAKA